MIQVSYGGNNQYSIRLEVAHNSIDYQGEKRIVTGAVVFAAFDPVQDDNALRVKLEALTIHERLTGVAMSDSQLFFAGMSIRRKQYFTNQEREQFAKVEAVISVQFRSERPKLPPAPIQSDLGIWE